MNASRNLRGCVLASRRSPNRWSPSTCAPNKGLCQSCCRFTASAIFHPKHFLRHEWHPIPHDVIGRSCQFVSKGIMRHHPFCLLHLAVVIASCVLIKATRHLCRFRECPGKILVSALPVPFALLLLVADPGGRNLSTVRYKIPNLGKPIDWASLQHNRQAQNLANAGFRQKL